MINETQAALHDRFVGLKNWPTCDFGQAQRFYAQCLPPGDGPLVEIGCGFGLHLRGLPESVRYLGIDYGYQIEFARSFGRTDQRFLKADFSLTLAETVRAAHPAPGSLVIFDRLEHFSSPAATIGSLVELSVAGWQIIIVGDKDALLQSFAQGARSNVELEALPLPFSDQRTSEAPWHALRVRSVRATKATAAKPQPTSEGAAGKDLQPDGTLSPEEMLLSEEIPVLAHREAHRAPKVILELDMDAVDALVLKAKAERSPFSLVRLGNGEGRFLGFPDFSTPLWVQRSIRNWFGIRLSSTHWEFLRGRLIEAIRDADIAGIPVGEARDAQWKMPQVAIPLYGAVPDSGNLCDQKINISWIDDQRFFHSLLAGEKSIGLISCHDLSAPLCSTFGVGSVDLYKIPGQAKFFKSDGVKPHYPDMFEDLVANVKVRFPGQIFFVGAGLPGKIYCSEIKRRGGIALDIGSILDVWAGFETRSAFKRRITEHRLTPDT